MRAGRMGFPFILKTASTGSSATGALVAVNSLQARKLQFGLIPKAGGGRSTMKLHFGLIPKAMPVVVYHETTLRNHPSD